MEQYNFFKGINSKIDGQIQKLQLIPPRQQKIPTTKQSKGIWDPSFFEPPRQQKIPTTKQSKGIWDPSFFEPPRQQKIPIKNSILSKFNFLSTREQSKDFIPEEINITHLKKNLLFQIMKEMMSEYLKRNHNLSLKKIAANLNENEVTTKTIKDKIILFGKLLSIPIVYEKKNIKFQKQIRTNITPFYNLKQKSSLNKIYEKNNLVSFTYANIPVLYETQYFLYSVLKSIKLFFPETIPKKYNCLTFENIYQLLQSDAYSSVTDFLTETFPGIFFIIKEIGYSSKNSPKFFRYIFINQPVQRVDLYRINTKKTKQTVLDSIKNSRIRKLYLENVVIKKPYSVSFKLLTSSKQVTEIPLDSTEEFCRI